MYDKSWRDNKNVHLLCLDGERLLEGWLLIKGGLFDTVEPRSTDIIQDLERCPSYRSLENIDNWLRAKGLADCGCQASNRLENALLMQSKDAIIICKQGKVIPYDLTWIAHDGNKKFDPSIWNSPLKLNVSVLRGNLQWQLFIRTKEWIRLMDVSFL